MSCEYAHSIFTLFPSVIFNSDNYPLLKLSSEVNKHLSSGLHFCFQALVFLSKEKQNSCITNNSISSLRFMIVQDNQK